MRFNAGRLNKAVAAGIVFRVNDGADLQAAVNNAIAGGDEKNYRFGLIALDSKGNLAVAQTKNVTVLAAWHDGEQVETFLDAVKK